MKTFVEKNWPYVADKSVAYSLNFVYMAYSYDSVHSDYFKTCCTEAKSFSKHYKDFEIPKSQIKKPYFQLDWYFYGINPQLKRELVDFGFDDAEDIFRPIYSKKDREIVAFSIEPTHVLKPIYKENDYNVKVICEKHDIVWASVKDENLFSRSKYDLGDPIYISKEALDDLHDFNYTYEYFGPGGYLVRKVIVSKRIYDFIISLYPRAEFRPVLIKEEPIETEEMKQKRLREQRLSEWRQSMNK